MNSNHNRISTFGIGKNQSIYYWKLIAWQLIHRGFCFQNPNKYYVVQLTAKAIPVLLGKEKIYLAISEPNTRPSIKKQVHLNSNDEALFAKLRILRKKIAQEEDKPPFVIFSDFSLQEMVRLKPLSKKEFSQISGVGVHKLQHYAPHFLKLIQTELTNE